ncbi:hypothetical protein F7725_009020 [Dissostichus mawsoni]|uniref:Ig-like domain-containing protein n=1 Tax=Dissostichus mawsoni TaxID=36200 RepID=A0A7J5Z7M6_DISMA|nr:hypothetical protein F7725_009020 [Dissostichus mawsoni]
MDMSAACTLWQDIIDQGVSLHLGPPCSTTPPLARHLTSGPSPSPPSLPHYQSHPYSHAHVEPVQCQCVDRVNTTFGILGFFLRLRPVCGAELKRTAVTPHAGQRKRGQIKGEKTEEKGMKMDKCLLTVVVGVLMLGGCSARVVTVSPGPLIRVEGQPVSIRCDVAEYSGPREQDFEWMMTRDTSGTRIKIISTFDAGYSHTSLSKRVASGDISVVRLLDNQVELKIAEVKTTDAGSDLTLSCNVTRTLTHPTYLSVTWSYARRYADGGIRLVPGKNGVFELVISRVMSTDEGIYECNGTEWTHEDGENWIKIVESTKEMGTVAVTPTGQSLSVKASSSSSSSSLLLTPGETLTLLCSVAADNLPSVSLEVSWLADGRDLITMEHSGVVISNNSSSGGALGNRGEASLERTGGGEYRLGVRGVSGEDGGAYTCRIRAFIEKGGRSSGGGGSFTVTLEAISNPQMTAEPTELACHVTNITHLPLGGRLGVTWGHTTLPGTFTSTQHSKTYLRIIKRPQITSLVQSHAGLVGGPQTSNSIGSLDGYGNLMPGAMYSDRLKSGVMSLTRVQPDTFKLRFLRTQYVCSVSAWSVSSQGDMMNTGEAQSAPLAVRWDTKRPTLNVVAKRLREASVGGATFEMSCAVATENLGEAGYSVLVHHRTAWRAL